MLEGQWANCSVIERTRQQWVEVKEDALGGRGVPSPKLYISGSSFWSPNSDAGIIGSICNVPGILCF